MNPVRPSRTGDDPEADTAALSRVADCKDGEEVVSRKQGAGIRTAKVRWPTGRGRRGASPSCSGIERPHRDLARMAACNAGAMFDEQRAVPVDAARPPLDRRSPRQHAHGPIT